MSSLKTRQLLNTLAQNYKHQKMSFSKSEISKRINEIKYLSAQKKIPRLTLRKEIAHLEIQLKTILELEKRLAKQKIYESTKIAALKKSNKQLRQRLAAAKDKDLHHKVDKLSHYLGEHLAKAKIKEDVQLIKQYQENQAKKYSAIQVKKYSENQENQAKKNSEMQTTNTDAQLHLLHQRLEALKQELNIKKMDDPDPQKIKLIEEQITILENRLKQLSNCWLPEHVEAVKPEVVGTEVVKSKGDKSEVVESEKIKSEVIKFKKDKSKGVSPEAVKPESSRHKMLFGVQHGVQQEEAPKKEVVEEKIPFKKTEKSVKDLPFKDLSLENLPLPPPPRITRPESRELNFSHSAPA